MFVARTGNITIEATGRSCTVPDDPFIKLAYYLYAVHCTDCPESIPSCYTSWERLSAGENRSTEVLRAILNVAEQYSPAKMQASGYFILVPPDARCQFKTQNKFITLTASSREVALLTTNAAALALVRNSSRSVKLMLYKEPWEDSNYYNPLRALYSTIRARENSLMDTRPQRLDGDACNVCSTMVFHACPILFFVSSFSFSLRVTPTRV
jgi:ferredoxin